MYYVHVLSLCTVIAQVTGVMLSCKPVYAIVHDRCTVTWNVSDYLLCHTV